MTKLQDLNEFLQASHKEINSKKKQRKIIFRVITSISILAVGGFLWALKERNETIALNKKISAISRSMHIAGLALNEIEANPTLAFRYAEYAYHVEPVPLARQMMYRSFFSAPFYHTLIDVGEGLLNFMTVNDSIFLLLGDNPELLKLNINNQKTDTLLICSGYKYGAYGVAYKNAIIPTDSGFIVTSSDSAIHCFSNDYVLKNNYKLHAQPLWTCPDKDGFISGLENGEVFIAKNNKENYYKLAEKGIIKMALLNDKLLGITSNEFFVFDLKRLTKTTILKAGEDNFAYFDYNNLSGSIVCATQNGDIILYDKEVKYIKQIQSRKNIREVKVSPDGKMIGVCYENHFQIFDSVLNLIFYYDNIDAIGILDFNFSNDSRFVAVGGNEKEIKVINLSSGRIIKALKGQESQITSCKFSNDGTSIFSTSYDGTFKKWLIHPSQEFVLKEHTSKVRSCLVKNNFILTAGWDHVLKIYTINGKLVKNIPIDINKVAHITPLNEDNILITGRSFKISKINLNGFHAAVVRLPNAIDDVIPQTTSANDFLTLSYGKYRDIYTKDLELVKRFDNNEKMFLLKNNRLALRKATSLSIVNLPDLKPLGEIYFPFRPIIFFEMEKNSEIIASSQKIYLRKNSVIIDSLPLETGLEDFEQQENLIVCKQHTSIFKFSVQNDKLIVLKLSGHTSLITKIIYFSQQDILVSGSYDGTVIFWNVDGSPDEIIKITSSKITDMTPVDDHLILACTNDFNCYYIPYPAEKIISIVEEGYLGIPDSLSNENSNLTKRGRMHYAN